VSLITILESLSGQLIALVAFFIFPIVQYILLRSISRKEGIPELWYLPIYGFRLVIRNQRKRRILKEIRYSVSIMESVVSPDGFVTKTTRTALSFEGERLFLFPKADLILMSFQLQSDHKGTRFIYTDDFGVQNKSINIDEFNLIRCDYLATIHNFFNFHIQIGKRVVINSSELLKLANATQGSCKEMHLKLDNVNSIV
jgi:hypothetical protein